MIRTATGVLLCAVTAVWLVIAALDALSRSTP